MISANGWDVVYKQAEYSDGSLLFPQKLSRSILDSFRRSLGPYKYANQYLNQVLPDEARLFKKSWFKQYQSIPPVVNTFVMIDPAISISDDADFTAVSVVDIDEMNNWYVRYSQRHKILPTELIELIFGINQRFSPMIIGIESVAFQKMLVYVLHEEARRRNINLPVMEVKVPSDKSKEQRIQSLVPRYAWGTVYHAQDLYDLETELLTFPRGEHDDLADSIAMLNFIQIEPIVKKVKRDPSPHEPGYEEWYIKNKLMKRSS